jgi:hypothetical protein
MKIILLANIVFDDLKLVPSSQLSVDDLLDYPISIHHVLARERTLLLKVVSQAAPRADHRPAVEERRLDADRVPAIHALLGIDALQDDHGTLPSKEMPLCQR